jgi:hypothetical protein
MAGARYKQRDSAHQINLKELKRFLLKINLPREISHFYVEGRERERESPVDPRNIRLQLTTEPRIIETVITQATH